MAFSDLKESFQEKEREYGCKYAAINMISQQAREKLSEVENKCKISEAIRWAVTGEEPKVAEAASVKDKICAEFDSVVSEVLESVHDDEVCSAVVTSIRDSKKEGHLIYTYQDVVEESRQARVRVLVRKLLFHPTFKW